MSDDQQSRTTANKRISGCHNEEVIYHNRFTDRVKEVRGGTSVSTSKITSKEEEQQQRQEEEEEEGVLLHPDSIPSSAISSSNAAAASSAPPVAFVEKDMLDNKQKAGKTDDGRSRAEALPETITSSSSHITRKQPSTTKEYSNRNNNNEKDGGVIAIKSEDSPTACNGTNNNQQRGNQGSRMTSIESEELPDNNDDAYSTKITRRSRRKRKEHPSSTLIATNTSGQANKKKRNNIQQGGKPPVVNSVPRTSPRNKKRHEEGGGDQKGNISSTTNDSEYSTDNETNCCGFCKDPDWENKIYYKCGTVISKYFPKSHNNPNPGWYRGTIRMHHVSSSNSGAGSGSDYEHEEEADSSSEVESEQHCIIYNEIHYEDGDMENITQDDLKLHLMDSRKFKMLHPTKMATASNSERQNHVDVVPPATSSDNKHDQKWLEKYNRLKQFQAKNGTCRDLRNYRPDPSLGNWVDRQRYLHKKGKIAKDRVEKLNDIGFDWVLVAETPDQAWQDKYDRLKIYKEENGHCRVPPRHGSDPGLANWVFRQRKQHKKGTLAADRAKKLEEIGFEWDALAETWDEMFGRLEQFKTENSHCRVPPRYGSDPSLGNWVHFQRTFYKKGKLAKDRVKKLNDIGFNWGGLAITLGLKWKENYDKLKKFKDENGHCRVPQGYGPDPSLAVWVKTQRKNHKKGSMAPDRAEKLNKIGFEWGVRSC